MPKVWLLTCYSTVASLCRALVLFVLSGSFRDGNSSTRLEMQAWGPTLLREFVVTLLSHMASYIFDFEV